MRKKNMNPSLIDGDRIAFEKWRGYKASFCKKWVKYDTQKQRADAKGRFLEQMVRLAFERLHYRVRTCSRVIKSKDLDFYIMDRKRKKVIIIEVSNWDKNSFSSKDYKTQKLRAFKGLLKGVRRIWITSFVRSLGITPSERKKLLRSPYKIHFLELRRDYNYNDTGYDDYVKIKEKIRKFLEKR